MSESVKGSHRSVTELATRATRVSDIYAQNFGITRDATWHLAKLTEELGELQAAYLSVTGNQRGSKSDTSARRALEDEAADLFGFLLVFAQWQGIDLEAAFERKWGKYLELPAEPVSGE
ncbi:hypothetical protein [Shimia sp. MMG029]|uniref:hypothetical protein n=1 Tax=Shimia sp. MMG029 TaxID=3021978 RepID=UPI0022FE24C1|nr:hypothetical protein [Shimia sp. MMG029]MDA5558202.1 hypothetical protein [Shimia sp. MMG029]